MASNGWSLSYGKPYDGENFFSERCTLLCSTLLVKPYSLSRLLSICVVPEVHRWLTHLCTTIFRHNSITHLSKVVFCICSRKCLVFLKWEGTFCNLSHNYVGNYDLLSVGPLHNLQLVWFRTRTGLMRGTKSLCIPVMVYKNGHLGLSILRLLKNLSLRPHDCQSSSRYRVNRLHWEWNWFCVVYL